MKQLQFFITALFITAMISLGIVALLIKKKNHRMELTQNEPQYPTLWMNEMNRAHAQGKPFNEAYFPVGPNIIELGFLVTGPSSGTVVFRAVPPPQVDSNPPPSLPRPDK